MDINEIMRCLPHRYPFLLIDKILEIEPGKFAKGIKNITINEPYFQGHFSGCPIVPGVLLIEMVAQMAAIVYTSTDLDNENASNKVGYIAKIEEVKFLNIVEPGDQLIIEVENMFLFDKFIEVKAEITSNNKTVLKGKIVVTQR